MFEKLLYSSKHDKVPYEISSKVDDDFDIGSINNQKEFNGHLVPEEALFYQMTAIESFIIKGARHFIEKVKDKK